MKLIINEWPRSGGTWFRDCLAECLGWRAREWTTESPDENVVIREHFYPNEISAEHPLVWLVRDPRDCVVSLYFMLRRWGEDYERPADITDCIRRHFIRGSINGVPKGGFATFCRAWLNSGRKYTLVHHESLMANRCEQVTQLLQSLGLEVDADKIVTVTDKWSKGLRPSYKQGYDRGQNPGGLVISAGASVWKEFLTPEHLWLLKRYCGDVALKLGYSL